jgi:RNA polymerase-binding protein DksA
MQKNTLTQTDLNAFHSILLSESLKVSSVSNDGLGILAAPGAEALDDQPPLLHEQFVAIHARRNDRQKLQQIDAALDRIRGGQFGFCQECAEGISRRRLEAIPWAEYCVPCQELVVEAIAQSTVKRAAA